MHLRQQAHASKVVGVYIHAPSKIPCVSVARVCGMAPFEVICVTDTNKLAHLEFGSIGGSEEEEAGRRPPGDGARQPRSLLHPRRPRPRLPRFRRTASWRRLQRPPPRTERARRKPGEGTHLCTVWSRLCAWSRPCSPRLHLSAVAAVRVRVRVCVRVCRRVVQVQARAGKWRLCVRARMRRLTP